MVDAGERRFRAERDGDSLGEVAVEQTPLQTAVAAVDLELPVAIEIEPVGAGELRTRIFGAWNGHR